MHDDSWLIYILSAISEIGVSGSEKEALVGVRQKLLD